MLDRVTKLTRFIAGSNLRYVKRKNPTTRHERVLKSDPRASCRQAFDQTFGQWVSGQSEFGGAYYPLEQSGNLIWTTDSVTIAGTYKAASAANLGPDPGCPDPGALILMASC